MSGERVMSVPVCAFLSVCVCVIEITPIAQSLSFNKILIIPTYVVNILRGYISVSSQLKPFNQFTMIISLMFIIKHKTGNAVTMLHGARYLDTSKDMCLLYSLE